MWRSAMTLEWAGASNPSSAQPHLASEKVRCSNKTHGRKSLVRVILTFQLAHVRSCPQFAQSSSVVPAMDHRGTRSVLLLRGMTWHTVFSVKLKMLSYRIRSLLRKAIEWIMPSSGATTSEQIVLETPELLVCTLQRLPF